MSTEEVIAVVLSANFAGERVANVLDVGDPARGIPVLFKGQDRKQQIDIALDVPGAIRTPGPKLRAYIIDDPNAAAMKPARQTQIEIRPINQNRCVGLALIYHALEFTKRAPEFRQRASNFPQAENRQLISFDDRFDT